MNRVDAGRSEEAWNGGTVEAEGRTELTGNKEVQEADETKATEWRRSRGIHNTKDRYSRRG